MSLEDFSISLVVNIVTIGFPFFLVFLFATPFLFIRYILKKPLRLYSVLLSIVIGCLLVALGLYAAYWGIAILQGAAARSLYEGTI